MNLLMHLYLRITCDALCCFVMHFVVMFELCDALVVIVVMFELCDALVVMFRAWLAEIYILLFISMFENAGN